MKQRLQWLAGLVLLTVAIALGVATYISLERREVARAGRDQAASALWKARSAGAARWAPDALARAEQAAHDAVVVMQAAEARLPILARFPAAAAAWTMATGAAREAAKQAAGNEQDARSRSEQAIAKAEAIISRVAATAAHVHLETDSRALLSRAQLALIESRNLHRQGEYVSAAARAEWAVGAGNRLDEETSGITGRYVEEGLVATWDRWKAQLLARSRAEGRPAILIEKADHRLTLYHSGERVRVYDVELGPNWISAKTRSGDSATPEGQYHIVAKKDRGASAYHRALLLSYPNDQDRKAFLRDRQNGLLPPAARLGGLIEIHGSGGRGEDWTSGCVAMSDQSIDDLFARVIVGTPVTIVGGDWQKLYERIAPREADQSAEIDGR
jgi:hypothetical protein